MKKTIIKLFGIVVLISATFTVGIYPSNYTGFEDIELKQLINVAEAIGETISNGEQGADACVNLNDQWGCEWLCESGNSSCYTSQ